MSLIWIYADIAARGVFPIKNQPKFETYIPFGNLNVGLNEPPRCYAGMKAQVLDYVPGKSLTLVTPVLESYNNPAGSMQGGIITAAFDNAFGILCYLVAGTTYATTVNISTTYHHPIFPGDDLMITATVKSKGKTIVHMLADAFNWEDKLIASATCSYMLLNRNKRK